MNDDDDVDFSDDDTIGDHADGANDACGDNVVDDVQGLTPKDLGKTAGHIWGDMGNVG